MELGRAYSQSSFKNYQDKMQSVPLLPFLKRANFIQIKSHSILQIKYFSRVSVQGYLVLLAAKQSKMTLNLKRKGLMQ